jgi:hypothetical protein
MERWEAISREGSIRTLVDWAADLPEGEQPETLNYLTDRLVWLTVDERPMVGVRAVNIPVASASDYERVGRQDRVPLTHCC